MSLAVLRHVANAKDINAVLGYMEQTGKVPEVEPIAPPEIAARDTAELLDPGDYFNPVSMCGFHKGFYKNSVCRSVVFQSSLRTVWVLWMVIIQPLLVR